MQTGTPDELFPRAGTHPTDGTRNQQREREQESAAERGSVLGGIDDGDGERWPRDWEGRRRAGKELGEVAKRGKDCCLLFFFFDCGTHVVVYRTVF